MYLVVCNLQRFESETIVCETYPDTSQLRCSKNVFFLSLLTSVHPLSSFRFIGQLNLF